jgi:hypothetical protein
MVQILTQEGRFKARPKTWAVEENRNTGTLQFTCAFSIIAAFNGTAWDDWAQYDLEKTGYFYLSKKDGSANEACIRSLREALGWDGAGLEALQNSDWSQVVVQITTGLEEFNGEKRLKIRFINPENWDGAQVKPLDQVALKTLNSKWGAKLRAVTPKQAPKPVTPAAPAAPGKPVPPLSPKAPAQSVATRESAWARVLEVFEGNAEAAGNNWAALLTKVCPTKPEASFTSADWASVTVRASEAIPF